MVQGSVAVVVNFCTNEKQFLTACIEQARLFAAEIIIPVCDHFFDGSSENLEELDHIYRAFPDCTFVQYPYIPDKIPSRIHRKISPHHFWHSLSRLLAVDYLGKDIEAVMFLDADEVPDGVCVGQWLDSGDYRRYAALKLANYWYFREACYQATTWEDSVLLVQRSGLTPRLLLQERERDAIYDQVVGAKQRNVVGCKGEPMFHHFSWVRTKEQMLKKVASWGHRKDKEWAGIVEEEFMTSFRGKDFVHGYEYKTIESPFIIGGEDFSFEPIVSQSKRVHVLSPSEVLIGLRKAYPLWWNGYRWGSL